MALVCQHFRTAVAIAAHRRPSADDRGGHPARLRLRAEFIDDTDQRAHAGADLDEMAQLLDDTLLFARQDGRLAPPPAPIDLTAEIAALVSLRHDMGQEVSRATLPAVAMAPIAPLALRRILANLLDKAAKYAGAVTLALVPEDGMLWKIDVADDGPGVPAAMLDRLGQPFERLDPSRDRVTGGAGLGLAIVKALVEEQGGQVRFANRPQGGFLTTLREWPPGTRVPRDRRRKPAARRPLRK